MAYFFTVAEQDLVAESSTPYQVPEEKTLLKHFRRIHDRNDKLVVLSVARLAAKGA